MGKDGFVNEKLIIEHLNGKKIGHLNDNMQKFVQYMFKNSLNSTDVIECIKKAAASKSDIIITSKGIEHSVSIKKGTGNSVHQEPLEYFINFLNKNFEINEKIANDLRLFIWGDGTLDGSGSVSERLSAPQITKKHPEIVNNIKEFFHVHKKDLIERFVIKGPKSNSAPDFIYYGDDKKGIWKDSESVLNWLSDDCNESTRAPIPVGRLTFQAWNRNINGGNKSEKKRGVIQLKWGSIGSDLKVIMDSK